MLCARVWVSEVEETVFLFSPFFCFSFFFPFFCLKGSRQGFSTLLLLGTLSSDAYFTFYRLGLFFLF